MPSPFPGMDPYLEAPDGWHPFHTALVMALANSLNSSLPDTFYAQVEQRTLVATWHDQLFVGQPDTLVIGTGSLASATLAPTRTAPEVGFDVLLARDEPIHERYLEIRQQGNLKQVVAVVEVLSYSNKLPGRDRDRYVQKRGQILASRTSFVELDLLRAGGRMPGWEEAPDYHYGAITAPGYRRPHGKLFGFTLREEACEFLLPLDGVAEEPVVSLQTLLADAYDQGRYKMQINYAIPPEPPLSAKDEAWVDALLREQGLR